MEGGAYKCTAHTLCLTCQTATVHLYFITSRHPGLSVVNTTSITFVQLVPTNQLTDTETITLRYIEAWAGQCLN